MAATSAQEFVKNEKEKMEAKVWVNIKQSVCTSSTAALTAKVYQNENNKNNWPDVEVLRQAAVKVGMPHDSGR